MHKEFGLADYIVEEGRLIIIAPSFDLDTFPALGERLVGLLSASVVEKQWDADIHSWLIDFEGCRLFMKAEHYSEAIWFEALTIEESREELDYLAGLFQRGF
ncbi:MULTISPECIES: DUF3630 family protein [Vibrio]|uniref:DUF3630 domain-containing protein n=1 Tax=Vibrio diabolicus TaxID=50719 RepID=A0ABN5HKF9_9VIBR|nr:MULTISPECIES: DUF3630 family protein [Vibrio]UFN69531.1 DUF3630 family protein [Vibrio alginolyticus]AVH27538.1 DUF3630 domain-containing protein [Vibrio diabolicus]MCF7373725.1 DUF3630 family protein [Vibrio sp. J2-3(2022)]MCS0369425.1 DUF3630 family protein [Vibrio diabolicus]MCZ0743133.1 DUF3630 family protein [Vibrio diabolicus]